jgi:hypothetical protein
MGVSDMLNLAERCEKADGPDRDLDYLIADAIGHGQLRADTLYAWGKAGSTNEPIAALPYTASINSAISVVPEGYDWAVFRTNGGLTVHAWCGSREDMFGDNPALALCAAALRARALTPKDDAGGW